MARFTHHLQVMALAIGLALTLPGVASAKSCKIASVVTHTGHVRDTLVTPNSIWVASDGGVQEFDRTTNALVKKYTHLDGLPAPSVVSLARAARGAITATVDGATCTLTGTRFSCVAAAPQAKAQKIRFAYHQGARITVEQPVGKARLVGTAGQGAYLGDAHLGHENLPGSHITALAIHGGRLWAGTFNGGLAREDKSGALRPHAGPGRLINALLSGPKHLFIGTSDGLYRTQNGSSFERVAIVEDAVVGLAFDGTSVWVSTPGALYRVRDGGGPPSDVWWLPGGSRSLQKVSAVPGSVWIGTEDRGAVHMKVGPRITAKDKPFTVFDRTRGLASSWSLAVAARPGGGAWMTTLREGVSLLGSTRRPHRAIRTAGLSDWGLSAMTTDSGAWLGTQGGAAHVTDDGAVALIEGLPDPRVHAFLTDPRTQYRGRLWIGTENGLGWCTPS